MLGRLIALAAAAAASPPRLPSLADPVAERLIVAIDACVDRMAGTDRFAAREVSLALNGVHASGPVPAFANIPAPPTWGDASDFRVDSPAGEIWITTFADRAMCRINAGDSPVIIAARVRLEQSLALSQSWIRRSTRSAEDGAVKMDKYVATTTPGVSLLLSGPMKLTNNGEGLQLLVAVSNTNGTK
jgi:hypothetical protein